MNIDHLRQRLAAATTAEEAHEYQQAQEVYESMLHEIPAAVRDPQLHSLRLDTWEKLGQLFYRIGRQDEALNSFRHFQQEAFTAQQKSKALTLLGNQLRYMGQLEEAKKLLQDALQSAAKQGDDMGQALAHQGLGGVFYESGRLEEAIEQFEKAMPGLGRAGDREQVMRTRNWQGLVYMRLGKTDKGIAAFQNALKQARLIGIRATSIVLGNLGEAYQHLFDMETALAYHQEAMRLAEGTQIRGDMADLARNLGLELVYLGRIAEGLAYLYQALDICKETGQVDVEQQTLYSLALAELNNKNPDLAQQHAQKLLTLARGKNARTYEADALHALGLCHQRQKEHATAEQLWQQASFLAHETEQRMLLWQIHAELAGIAPDAGLAAVHRRIAAEVIEQIAYPIEDEQLRSQFLNAPPVQAVLSQVEN